jgi:type I restriction enzyme S subunit
MLKGYGEYKNTNHDWLPQIPAHWKWVYLSQSCKEQCVKNSEGKNDKVLSLSYGNIIIKKDINFGLVPKEYSGYQIVDKGNIILRLTDLQNDHTSLRTGLVKERGIITSAYTCLKPYENPNYLQYLLHSYDTLKVFYGLGGGVRQSIGFKEIRNMNIPLPPRPEQDQIVCYLDWKVSMINKYINAKKKQIELLKERKQAIINQAVTKGLDSKTSMKDSGVDWLGKIPAHWEIRKLKTLGIARNGLTFEPKDLSDDGILVLRSSNIKNNQLSFDDNTYVKMSIKENLILQENDLLICSRNGSRELIGKCALIDKRVVGQTYGAFMCAFRGIYNEYIYYIFQSNILNYYLGTFTTSTINQLTNSNLYSIVVPFPAKNERKKITIFLKAQCAVYDGLVNKYMNELTLVTEYRTHLISDVVTGRVNVQNIKVPKFAIDDQKVGGK